MTTPSPPLLEAHEIALRRPGAPVLESVSLSVAAGEVVAVVGANGSGRSALLHVLAGLARPDAGSVTGTARPRVALVRREPRLLDNLSVAANLFLGRERGRGPFGLMSGRRTGEVLARVGLKRPPHAPVADLSPPERLLVEVARALAAEPKVLLLDEPTAWLPNAAAERLFALIGELKASGVGVVYVPHRVGEVQKVADRFALLRDGRILGGSPASEARREYLLRLMLDGDPDAYYPRRHRASRQDVFRPGGYEIDLSPAMVRKARERAALPARLEVRGLRWEGGPNVPTALRVGKGEVVGLTGLAGAGARALAEALFGLRAIRRGEVVIDGEVATPRSPGGAAAAGIVLVPAEDQALFPGESVARNLTLPSPAAFRPWGRERLARSLAERVGLAGVKLSAPVGSLSPGERRKVAIGRWLEPRPKVMILDEPTRGLGRAARHEVYTLLDELAGAGVSVLLVSTDPEEIVGVSDRVLVMANGRVVGELAGPGLTDDAVRQLAGGGGEQS